MILLLLTDLARVLWAGDGYFPVRYVVKGEVIGPVVVYTFTIAGETPVEAAPFPFILLYLVNINCKLLVPGSVLLLVMSLIGYSFENWSKTFLFSRFNVSAKSYFMPALSGTMLDI